MSHRRPRTNKRNTKQGYPVQKFDVNKVNFRVYIEKNNTLETKNQELRTITCEELTMKDTSSDEYKKIIQKKKEIAQEIKEIEETINRNSPRFDELDIRSANSLIKNIEQHIKSLDEEILNTDNDTESETLEEIMENMKEIQEQLIIKESTLRQEQVNNFTRQAKQQRINHRKQDKNKTYNIARKDAENTIMGIFILDNDEIASMFSTDTFFINHEKGPVKPQKMLVSWPHIIRGRENNIIPLSPGIQIPKRFDTVKKQTVDHIFTLSSFFKNPKFISKVNEHYSPLGLDLNVKQDKKYKNKWWISLRVISIDNKIQFPVPKIDISNIDLKIKPFNPFEESDSEEEA